jgi:DNA-binding NarL/FixJ family response regulator
MAVRVMLVDDIPEVRVMLRTAMRLRSGLEVVAEASTSQSARTLAESTKPDIVVLDLRLPDDDGRQTFFHMREVAPNSFVVVYAAGSSDRNWYEDRGVPFVRKDDDLDALFDAIRLRPAG